VEARIRRAARLAQEARTHLPASSRAGALLPDRDLVEASAVSIPRGLGPLRRRLPARLRFDCAARLPLRGIRHGVALRRVELADELGAAGAAYPSSNPMVRR